ncbi:MAG TPA: sodium-translocating pyrophosphatase [Ktedonobacterales bacterium]
MDNFIWIAVPFAASVVAILLAFYLVNWILRRDQGDEKMQKVARAIFQGAQAFIGRQYRTIGILAIVAAIVVGGLLAILSGNASTLGGVTPFGIAWRAAVAFLIGAGCSILSGLVGMNVAVRSNSRVASAARNGLGDALLVGLRGGAVTGFLVIALSLLGVTLVYVIYHAIGSSVQDTPVLIVGFGFGASFVALFAQLGGGIYTKAADVGADLVGKVEAGIPEDDPRNPAVIADLVGDNVGDCAGRGADLFESTAAENIGAMILGASVYDSLHQHNVGWIIFPLVVVGFGIIASMIGLLAVRSTGLKEPSEGAEADAGVVAMGRLNVGYYVTAALSIVGIVGLSYALLDKSNWYYFAIAGIVGIANSIAFVYITQYYTSGKWRPVRLIAEASKTGPGTNIIAGLAVGFENTALPVVAICASLGLAYWLGTLAGIPSQTGGIISTGGIYATAVATMGMLMSASYILAMDSFGPITDNAGGIVEMSGAPDEVRVVTDALDSVGNTTKALTKGYGIGSAALAAFLLFSAYLDVLQRSTYTPQGGTSYSVNLANPPIFIAALLGAALIFLFSSLAIRAVGRTAQSMIEEVRRQFKANPKIMAGEADPDYASCVDISTRAALKQMVVPGVLVVACPIIVGLTLGPEAAAGFLMVGTIGGILMALVMNNGGGAWDNAKKFIEAGHLRDEQGVVLGKKTPAHQAAVVGDTVGDPFKDTAGPSLHIVIKLLSTITLVLAPLFIFFHPHP